MTATNAFVMRDTVHVFTDGWLETGSVARKVATIPHLDLAIAVRGHGMLLATLAAIVIEHARSFDEAVEQCSGETLQKSEARLRSMIEKPTDVLRFQVLLAGFRDDEPCAVFVSNLPEAQHPWEPLLVRHLVAPNDGIPAELIARAHADSAGTALDLFEAQRASPIGTQMVSFRSVPSSSTPKSPVIGSHRGSSIAGPYRAIRRRQMADPLTVASRASDRRRPRTGKLTLTDMAPSARRVLYAFDPL